MSTVYVVAARPATYVDGLAEARAKMLQRLDDVGDNFRVTLNGEVFTTTGAALEYLVMFRAMVDERRTTLSDTIYFYTNITTALMTAMFQNTQIDDIGGVWTKFTAYMFLLRAIDKLGVQRALGASYFATCYISTGNRFWVRTLQSNSDGFIGLAMVHYPVLATTHESKLADLVPVIQRLSRSVADVLDPNTTTHCRELADDERVDVAMDFFKDMTSYIAHYQGIGTSVLTDIVDNVETASRDATVNVIIYAIVAVCVLLLSAALITWYVRKIRGMILQIRTYATSTAEKMNEVKGNARRHFHWLVFCHEKTHCSGLHHLCRRHRRQHHHHYHCHRHHCAAVVPPVIRRSSRLLPDLLVSSNLPAGVLPVVMLMCRKTYILMCLFHH